MSKQIPDTAGVGRIPDWNKVSRSDGKPLTDDDKRRFRVRQAMARGDQITGPADMAEAARQTAAEALAMSEVTRQNMEAAERAAANAARQREAMAALERERDRDRRGQPIARQHSSSGGDPFGADLDHDDAVMDLVKAGAPMAEISAKMAEVKAQRDRDRAERAGRPGPAGIHGSGPVMWQTPQLMRDPYSGRMVPQTGPDGIVTGDLLMDDTTATAPVQISIIRTGVPELGTDPVPGSPASTRHFQAPVTGHAPGTRPPKVSEYWSTAPAAGPPLAHPEGGTESS